MTTLLLSPIQRVFEFFRGVKLLIVLALIAAKMGIGTTATPVMSTTKAEHGGLGARWLS